MFGNVSYWQGIRLFLLGNSIELTDLENIKNEIYTKLRDDLPFYGVEPYETKPYNQKIAYESKDLRLKGDEEIFVTLDCFKQYIEF